jgi:hypothetical protein
MVDVPGPGVPGETQARHRHDTGAEDREPRYRNTQAQGISHVRRALVEDLIPTRVPYRGHGVLRAWPTGVW